MTEVAVHVQQLKPLVKTIFHNKSRDVIEKSNKTIIFMCDYIVCSISSPVNHLVTPFGVPIPLLNSIIFSLMYNSGDTL